MNDLLPPVEVSSNGQEIFAWSHRLSEHMHRQARIRELHGELARTGKRCDHCDNWMKSSQCPLENNVRGMTRGPSCESPICGSFVETRHAGERREKLKAELHSLSAAALTQGA